MDAFPLTLRPPPLPVHLRTKESAGGQRGGLASSFPLSPLFVAFGPPSSTFCKKRDPAPGSQGAFFGDGTDPPWARGGVGSPLSDSVPDHPSLPATSREDGEGEDVRRLGCGSVTLDGSRSSETVASGRPDHSFRPLTPRDGHGYTSALLNPGTKPEV